VCLPVTRESAVAPHNRERKGKKEIKETNDKWTYSRMRPLGCSILPPPKFPSLPKLFRMISRIPNDLRTRPIGKTRHRPRQAQTEPLQSRETSICTTSVWENYLVSTACLPHDSPSISNPRREPDWKPTQRHRHPPHPPPSSTIPPISSFLPSPLLTMP
jgi:hypothetical protein